MVGLVRRPRPPAPSGGASADGDDPDRPDGTAKEPPGMSTEPRESTRAGHEAARGAARPDVAAAVRPASHEPSERAVISDARTVRLEDLHAYYGDQHAVKGVS